MAPIGKHWMNFVYVNLGYIAIISVMVYYIYVKEIKKNWGKYRCNPMFMFFSDDIAGDFTKCITTQQNNSIGPLLEPTTSSISELKENSNEQSEKISQNTSAIGNLGSMIESKISGISSTFSNTSIEFQKITYGIKDLMAKLTGIVVTLMYIMDGNSKTMTSIWKGPPGQVMRKLATLGHCFHPTTKVKLQNGEIVNMQDVVLGSILENGSKVISVMKIDNTLHPESLMCIESKGVNGENIYCTGSHLIKEGSKFIKVANHTDAICQTKITSDWYSCLITDNHLIKIGQHTFWDWEDYYCNFI
jgi:hypothetical protein